MLEERERKHKGEGWGEKGARRCASERVLGHDHSAAFSGSTPRAGESSPGWSAGEPSPSSSSTMSFPSVA
eukprot:5701379-Pyramimonas_sp.AAC.2